MNSLRWCLRRACADRHIRTAAELRRLVARRTGVTLSEPTVEAYFRDQLPQRIDARTLTAVLNALACPLEEVIQFTPPATASDARASEDVVSRYQRPRRLRQHGGRVAIPGSNSGATTIGKARTPRGRPRSTRKPSSPVSPLTEMINALLVDDTPGGEPAGVRDDLDGVGRG